MAPARGMKYLTRDLTAAKLRARRKAWSALRGGLYEDGAVRRVDEVIP